MLTHEPTPYGNFFEYGENLAERLQKNKEKITFTEQLRLTFAWILQPTAQFLNRIGVQPNMLTLAGLIGTGIGGYYLSQGNFRLGAVLIGLMSLVDAFDGPLARLRGEPRNFGAFVDSVSDRYSELFIYAGLLWYSLVQDDNWLSLAVYFAGFGSVLVSYTRARAQSLGMDAKVGLFSRVERIFILGVALFFNFVFWGVAIVALGSNLTAFRRVWHVRAEAHKHESYHHDDKKEQ